MPSKNINKEYSSESYYHIYNRGVEKRQVFLDGQDYNVFLNLFKRYLSKQQMKDNYGRDGVSFYNDIELLAFCLMPNHFHMLVYQHENPRAISELLRRVCTSYSLYFNRKYKRVGPLFQSRFKASRVSNDSYLQHISRYIHLNPKQYTKWAYSSWHYYTFDMNAEWVRPQRILEIFEGESYAEFVADYEDQKQILEDLKYELADS